MLPRIIPGAPPSAPLVEDAAKVLDREIEALSLINPLDSNLMEIYS